MIKLLIFGPTGSMGKLISELALADDEIDVVAACDMKNIGDKLSSVAGVRDPNDIIIESISALPEVITRTTPDVAIDFTIASATEKNSVTCIEHKVRCVIGTTALSSQFLEQFENVVKNHNTPAVISPNMSTGVNVFFKVIEILTHYLDDWDIEVIEAHHHRKQDIPSGTALKIGEIIANVLGSSFKEIARYGRAYGLNKRLIGGKEEIGVHSIRAGDIVGDHTVLFAGPGERIEFKHQAHSRYCFATGALKAVKFIAKAREAKLYSTGEVLGL
jgi:4-hydroxy-tetrahydrodipicolinate reductase